MLAGTLIAGCRAGVPAFAETSTAAPTTYAESTVMESVVAETIEDETSSKDKKDTKEDTKKESRLKNEGLASVKTDDVETGANEFSKKVTYESYDPDDDITKHLPETVEANGETYNITEWKQPLVVSKEEVVPKTLSYESEVFTGDETEHEPDDEISYEDGTTYVLSSKELHEQSTKERSEYKESVVSYNGVEDGVQIKKKRISNLKMSIPGRQ